MHLQSYIKYWRTNKSSREYYTKYCFKIQFPCRKSRYHPLFVTVRVTDRQFQNKIHPNLKNSSFLNFGKPLKFRQRFLIQCALKSRKIKLLQFFVGNKSVIQFSWDSVNITCIATFQDPLPTKTTVKLIVASHGMEYCGRRPPGKILC